MKAPVSKDGPRFCADLRGSAYRCRYGADVIDPLAPVCIHIKRLRGLSRPQFRLRVGEIRVFYDVSERSVEVLAIVAKAEADAWLPQFGSLE